jgi:hypothetical protein
MHEKVPTFAGEHLKHTTMKRTIITLVMAAAWLGTNAMSYERAREEALYLTDKMAYELNLNDQQYNDAYEINLDYLMSLDDERDLYGRYLEFRLNDLRHILFDWQYDLMLAADYFVRPVIWRARGWYFPIYTHYRYGWFYYDRPAVFWSYRGGHGRLHFRGGNYYVSRRPAWHGGMRGMDMDRRRWNNPSLRNGHGDTRMNNGRLERGGGVPRSRGEFSGTRGNSNIHGGTQGIPNRNDNMRGGNSRSNGQGTFRPETNHGTDTRTITGNRSLDSRTITRDRGITAPSRGTTTTSRGSVMSGRGSMPSSHGSVSSSRGSGSMSRGTVSSSSRGNLFSGSSTRSTVGSSRSNSSMGSGVSRGSSGSRGGSISSTRSSGASGHSAGSQSRGGSRGGRR